MKVDVKVTGPLGCHIYLNDEMVHGVVSADEEAGTLVRYQRDETGKYVIKDGDLLIEELRGRVRIQATESQRRCVEACYARIAREAFERGRELP